MEALAELLTPASRSGRHLPTGAILWARERRGCGGAGAIVPLPVMTR